jgi:hypothetical protein
MDLGQLRKALTEVDVSNVHTLMREYADIDGWESLLGSEHGDLGAALSQYVCPSRREEFLRSARECGI